MAISTALSGVFLFLFTTSGNPDTQLAFSSLEAFFQNIMYGVLYAYTPEVLPTAHRATGNGVAVACNRLMGILSSVIATEANNTGSPAAIYVCAALFAVMALVSALFPFEPYGRRSS